MTNTNQHNPTYFITGATGYLGQGLALAAAKKGATLILHGRNQQALADLDDRIQSHAPTTTLLWPLDFLTATEITISKGIEELSHHINSINGLFHCAVSAGEQVRILSEPHETWLNVIRTNVEVPRLLIKHLLPLLSIPSQANILFFKDISDQQLYQGAFAQSKTMLQHLVQQLNFEFENINSIKSVMIPLKPLYSPLRAKRFPGESPESNARVETIAPEILKTVCL